jgi:hypothetical protein
VDHAGAEVSTEHVVIQFDAQTQAVVRAVEGIEARLQQLGHAHARQSRSMQAALDRITTAGQRVAYHYGLIHRSIAGLLSPMSQVIRKALDWEQSITRLGGAVGGVVDNMLEGVGVTDGMSGAVDGLVSSIGDADSAVGSLIRDGLSGLVTVGETVIGTMLEMSYSVNSLAESVVSMVGSVMQSVNQLSTIPEDLNAASTGHTLLDELERLDELELAYQRVIDEQGRLMGEQSPERMAYEQQRRVVAEAESRSTERNRAQDEAQAWVDAQNAAIDEERRQREADLAQLRDDIDRAENAVALAAAGLRSGLEGDSTERVRGGASRRGGGGSTTVAQTWLAAALIQIGEQMDAVTDATPSFTGAIERVASWLGGGEGKGGAYDKGGQQGIPGLYDTMLSDKRATQSSLDAALEQGFAGLPGAAASALGDVSTGIADFVRGTEGAFASMGEALKSTLAGALGSIGSALTQGALSAAISGTMALGPIGLIVGLGMALLTASGLLGGTGGGATANAQQMAQQADVFGAIRTDTSGGGGSIVYHTSIGAYFGDPERSDAAARGVAGGLRRLRRTGEMPR